MLSCVNKRGEELKEKKECTLTVHSVHTWYTQKRSTGEMHFGFGAPKLTQLARRIFVCKDTREEIFFAVGRKL